MVKNKQIFLIGPMGAGKTTVGLELARLTGLNFIDTDQLLELRMQSSARQILNQYGEAFLRHKESEILAEVSEFDSVIIATGGGCILLEKNRDLLKLCNVYYLLVSPKQQFMRLLNCVERGLLPDDHNQRLKFFQDMALQRKHLYESVATVRINTDQSEVSDIVQQIIESL